MTELNSLSRPGKAAREFIRGLAAAGKKEYEVFDLLDKSPWPENERISGGQCLARAVDFHIREELNNPDGLYGTVESLIVHPFTPGVLLLQFWSDCLEAVHPHRPTMNTVIGAFHEILDHVKPIHPDYLKFIPFMLSHLKHEGVKLLPRLSDLVESLMSNGGAGNFFTYLREYLPFVDGPMFRGVMEVGGVVFHSRPEMRQRFGEVFPPDEQLAEEHHREKFLVKVGGVFVGAGEEREILLDLALTAGKVSPGSAVQILARLAKPSALRDGARRMEYLRALVQVIRSAGIAAVSFGLNKLPNLMAHSAPEQIGERLLHLEEISSAFGCEAAFAFLEKF